MLRYPHSLFFKIHPSRLLPTNGWCHHVVTIHVHLLCMDMKRNSLFPARSLLEERLDTERFESIPSSPGVKRQQRKKNNQKPLTTTTFIIVTGLLFTILLSTFGSQLSSFKNKINDTEQIIIDFSNTSATGWQIVNDRVMGGISRSSFQLHEDGYALFSGTVSLENNGGFASVRTRAQTPMDLSEFDGLSVHVLGDGKTYSLRLRTVKNGKV